MSVFWHSIAASSYGHPMLTTPKMTQNAEPAIQCWAKFSNYSTKKVYKGFTNLKRNNYYQ